MTYKEKIRFLNSYYYAVQNFNDRSEELERMFAIGTKITSVNTGMPHASDNSSKVERSACGIASLLEQIEHEKKQFEIQRNKVKNVIDSVEKPSHRLILSKRYIDFKKFSEIAKDIGTTERNVYSLHKKIVQDLKV